MLNVSVEQWAFCLLAGGIETQEFICNSKFALMVFLPAARGQEDRWFDGIIGKNTLQILIFLKNNASFSFYYFLIDFYFLVDFN